MTSKNRKSRGGGQVHLHYGTDVTSDLLRLFGHGIEIGKILSREGCPTRCHRTEPVVDFDAVMADRHRGANKPESVDIVIGLESTSIRLVECKFRENPQNTRLGKIKHKIEQSKQLLRGEGITQIEKTTLILYPDKKVAPALHNIRRQHPKCMDEDLPIRPLSVSDLLEQLFDKN